MSPDQKAQLVTALMDIGYVHVYMYALDVRVKLLSCAALPHACAVYTVHYPSVPLYSDMEWPCVVMVPMTAG